MKTIVALAVIAMSQGAMATDLTVAGLTIGQPLSLPECQHTTDNRGWKSYTLLDNQLCVRFPKTLGRPDWIGQTGAFPSGDYPSIMKDRSMALYVKDGILVGLSFRTSGLALQEVNLKTLTDKYGPPTVQQISKVQNRMGAVFDSINASWTLPEITVTFLGTAARIDEGWVSIDTPAGAELRKAADAESDKARNSRKL